MPNSNNDSSIQITQKSNYIPAFDGIRAIAILLVLFSHSVIYDQFNSLRNIGLNLGYTGVSIFFVLSGYLITRLLIQEEEKNGKISLKFFYIRRAFRLLPALWLYLLVVFVLWIAGLLPNHPWHSFLTSLLYIRNLIGSGHETDHIWQYLCQFSPESREDFNGKLSFKQGLAEVVIPKNSVKVFRKFFLMYSLYYKGLRLSVTFQVKHLCVGDFGSFAQFFAGFYFGRGIVILHRYFR